MIGRKHDYLWLLRREERISRGLICDKKNMKVITVLYLYRSPYSAFEAAISLRPAKAKVEMYG